MKAKRKSVPDECPASPIAEHIHSEVRKAVEQLENQLDMTTSAAAGDDDDGGGGDGGFDVVDMLPEAAEEMGTGGLYIMWNSPLIGTVTIPTYGMSCVCVCVHMACVHMGCVLHHTLSPSPHMA